MDKNKTGTDIGYSVYKAATKLLTGPISKPIEKAIKGFFLDKAEKQKHRLSPEGIGDKKNGFSYVEDDIFKIITAMFSDSITELKTISNKIASDPATGNLLEAIVNKYPQDPNYAFFLDHPRVFKSWFNAIHNGDTLKKAEAQQRISCIEQISLYTLLYNFCKPQDGSTAHCIQYTDMTDQKYIHFGLVIADKNGTAKQVVVGLTDFVIDVPDKLSKDELIASVRKTTQNQSRLKNLSMYDLRRRAYQAFEVVDEYNKKKKAPSPQA